MLLGIWDEGSNGLSYSHQVGLWSKEESTYTLIEETEIGGAGDFTVDSNSDDGRWVFKNITAITLSPGTYVLGAYYNYQSQNDFVRVDSEVTVIGDGVIEYKAGKFKYDDFGAPNLTSYIDRPNYFGPNINGDLVEPIPEPTTMLLLASGLIGLAGLRRKFKNRRQ